MVVREDLHLRYRVLFDRSVQFGGDVELFSRNTSKCSLCVPTPKNTSMKGMGCVACCRWRMAPFGIIVHNATAMLLLVVLVMQLLLPAVAAAALLGVGLKQPTLSFYCPPE